MKTKIAIKKFTRYLRDFSIVVAGIAVTLYVNDRITYKSEKRDLKLYFQSIKLELEENVRDLDEQYAAEQTSVNYGNYLKNNDIKAISRDSIKSYAEDGYGFYTIQTVTYKTYAFEMFKLSGTMRLMDNKELLIAVWKAYTSLDEIKKIIEMGYQYKIEEAKKEVDLALVKKKKHIPLYNFYVYSGWANEFQRFFGEAKALLQETIDKIDKEYEN